MRAFTIGIHFINTIHGGRSGTSEASNAILHHNGELLLQLCSNIFGLFILYTIAVTVSTTASICIYIFTIYTISATISTTSANTILQTMDP